ncbi:MAG: flagellar hook-associated protein FlgK [Deltaproteobacteria bacterium]|nr:flagellar hook-associated protein FlgK [Deltaproteobacteria bacterium]
MAGISLLSIATDALFAHKTAIDVTGSNIANVNTPGYTRQRPVFSTKGTLSVSLDDAQTSVDLARIDRLYDRFVEVQIGNQLSSLEYNKAKQEALQRVETLVNESDGQGINALLNDFWNAWQDLAANPGGETEKAAVVSVADSLTMLFRSYDGNIRSIQDDVDNEITGLVDEVNNIVSELGDLNGKIALLQAGNGNVNNLLDRRTELVKNLASIVNVNYFEDDEGQLNVFLDNGMPLAEGEKVWLLDVRVNSDNHSYRDVIFRSDPSTAINNVLSGGRIAGLLEIRDETMPSYRQSLDTLAAALVTEVNKFHAQGYDSYGNPGGSFFDESKTAAGNISLADAISDDPGRVAASYSVNNDGEAARGIGALKDMTVLSNGTATIGEFYTAFLGRVGRDVNDATRYVDHGELLKGKLLQQRENLSGVSIDEEMVNLIRYQQGYNAAAKLVTAVQDLTDTLMEMIR